MKPRDKASAKRKTGELSTHCSGVSPQISGYLRSIPPRHSGSDDDNLKVKMQQKFLKSLEIFLFVSTFPFLA
jgi:hypothetical protein